METRTDRVPKSTPATRDISVLVPVYFPAQIARGRFVDHRRNLREVGCDVVLETVAANVVQQVLHARNLYDAVAAESLHRVVGETALSDVAGDSALAIV